jgi:F-type H+-transporting ATPase subunit delta
MASGAAKRYTEAVFSIAREKGTFEQWQRDLDALATLMSDPSASDVMTSPNYTRDQKMAVLNSVLANGQPESKNLAALLLDRNRLHIAPDMSELFREYALAELGIVVADVTTATPIDKDAEAAIKAQLSRLIGKQVDLRTHVDESLIGGVVARVGDQLIDGSVSSQLRRLRNRLGTGA